MDTLVSQIKLLMKNEADKAINYMTVYLEQISLYFQVSFYFLISTIKEQKYIVIYQTNKFLR